MNRLLLLLTFLLCTYSYGQETSSIQGNILDGELYNEPLLMANVSIKNTTFTTHTNFRGNFEFNELEPGTYQIVVQYLGYETIELPITINPGETSIVQTSLKAKTVSLPNFTIAKTASK